MEAARIYAAAVVGNKGSDFVAAVGEGRAGWYIWRVGWALAVGVALALGGHRAGGCGGARGVHRAPAGDGLILVVSDAGDWVRMHEG